MQTLDIYVDESSEGQGNGVFLLAAYAAPSNIWSPFVDEWTAVVEESPSLWPYHAVDWRSSDWLSLRGTTRTQAEERENRLRNLINRTPFRFHATSAVSEPLFRQLISDGLPPRMSKRPYSRWIRQPYHLCHGEMVKRSLGYASRWNALRVKDSIDKVNFFVEENGVITDDATKSFEYARSESLESISALMGRHESVSKSCAAVQAADLLAYHYLSYFKERKRSPELDRITNSDWLRYDWSRLSLQDLASTYMTPIQDLHADYQQVEAERRRLFRREHSD